MAHEIALSGTCSRLQVGALLVKDNRIVSMGYNGTAHGLPHCNHHNDKPCHASVHAETNVVAFAAKNGISSEGSTMYVTTSPCDSCAGIIINAGVARIKYNLPYRNDNGLLSLKTAGLIVEQFLFTDDLEDTEDG